VNTKRLGLLTLIIFAVNLSMWASNEKTLPFRTEVTLNGTRLPVGLYQISWVSHSPEATVTFVRVGKVMVTAMGKWVERDTTYKADALVYSTNADGSHTLLEIRFAGRKQALVFTGVS
jgi:hypothetical protein